TLSVCTSVFLLSLHHFCSSLTSLLIFFFFNDTATTEIYTLSLHDALPISVCTVALRPARSPSACRRWPPLNAGRPPALPARSDRRQDRPGSPVWGASGERRRSPRH